MERTIQRVRGELADPELATLFENCFPNTLDTTVGFGDVDGRPDTFVITGDIEAMWLRDSTAQVWPYLPLVSEDAELKRLVAGVLNRQTRCILIDPYANAFNKEPGESEWKDDLTDMKPELHERKWEVDSLCYPIRLAHRYWRLTGDAPPCEFLWSFPTVNSGGPEGRADRKATSTRSMWTWCRRGGGTDTPPAWGYAPWCWTPRRTRRGAGSALR